MNHTYSTSPAEPGTWHHWQVGNDHGSLTLTALHTATPLAGPLADLNARHGLPAPTDGGRSWVFDIMQIHVPVTDHTDWPCLRHGATCDVDAVVPLHAKPAWQRITAAGVTDDAVYSELDLLHAEVFADVTR